MYNHNGEGVAACALVQVKTFICVSAYFAALIAHACSSTGYSNKGERCLAGTMHNLTLKTKESNYDISIPEKR